MNEDNKNRALSQSEQSLTISEDQKREINNWHKSLAQNCVYSDEQIDSKITYVGAGAIAISMSSSGDYKTSIIFCFGIGLMLLSIIVNLISQPVATCLSRKYMKITGAYIRNEYKGILQPSIEEQIGMISLPINMMNWFSVICLCVGAILLFIPIIL